MSRTDSKGLDAGVTCPTIRLSAGGLRLAGCTIPTHGEGASFADAIRERYAGRWSIWGGESMILRRLRPAVWVQPHYHHTRLHLTPRLALTVVTQPRAEEPRPVETITTTAHPARQTDTPAVPGRDVPASQRLYRVETTPIEQVVRRLVRRGTRIESVSAPRQRYPQLARHEGGQGQPLWTPPSPGQPVERVVRRPAAVQVETEPPHIRAWPAVSPVGGQLPPAHPQPPEPAPIDLDHLTERVVRAIDRRVLAYRERTGRI